MKFMKLSPITKSTRPHAPDLLVPTRTAELNAIFYGRQPLMIATPVPLNRLLSAKFGCYKPSYYSVADFVDAPFNSIVRANWTCAPLL
jgi:hypothetical protein